LVACAGVLHCWHGGGLDLHCTVLCWNKAEKKYARFD
jgi:hypothetical protein